MAPRSPTNAFAPTPALEQNPTNYSPFNHHSKMLSFDTHPVALTKGVRFSEPSTAGFHRAHSIATETVPLLPAIASASTVPKQAFRIANPAPGIDITAYIENCRNLNEQLRQAHEAERRAWNIERTALKSRIADLEFQVNKSNDTRRRASNDAPHHIPHSAMKHDFRAMFQANKNSLHKTASDSVVPTAAPVWRVPESTHTTTRVFQTDEANGHHLPRISEDESFPSLSKEVSPHTAVDNDPIPIVKVDSTLDGITLRSAALTSSFEAKVTSPEFGSPTHSPTAAPAEIGSSRDTLHIDASTLVSPLDEKLKRHAGHTPMAFYNGDANAVTSDQGTETPTPIPMVEKPIAPAPTARPPLRPSENSDSYFSFTSEGGDKGAAEQKNGMGTIAEEEDPQDPQFEPENDKPLTGPLMLDPSARTDAASAFLEKLDAKLEAVREASPDRRQSYVSVSSTGDGPAEAVKQQVAQPAKPEEPEEKPEMEDDMPKLKLKKSTNFGSAYGWKMPGRM